MKPKLFISFSGGRTSAFMTRWILDNHGNDFDWEVVFANTGQEREETLEFVDRCDHEWGLNVTWVEAVTHHGEPIGCTHRIVDYKTADRTGQPFEEVIKKYGISNQSYPHCTRELKLNPMRSYIKSLGWDEWTTAIGIRADEMDRMNSKFKALKFWYPLIKLDITKQDVIRWWKKQPFDLGLKEHQGNCKWCWKKSFRKHFTLINEDPTQYEFPARMEERYAQAGSGDGSRVFFRGNTSTEQLLEMAKSPFTPFVESDGWKQELLFELDEPGGCSESCDAFTGDFDFA